MTAMGKQQAETLAAVARYCKAHSIPPLDRGLRSIVAQQTANLLKGGWPVAEIQAMALELASQYDRAGGHKAMTQLQRSLEVADEDRDERAHADRRREELAHPIDPAVASVLPVRARPRPSSHAFVKSERPNSCAVCEGPVGVHVRAVGVDHEGQAILAPIGVAK